MDVPLAKHLHFHAQDPDQACLELAKEYVEHQLSLKKKGDKLNATHNQVSLSGLSLNFLEYGAEVEISASIEDFYLIQIPLSGSTWIKSGKESGLSNNEVAFITPYNKKITQRWSADSKQIHVKITRSVLEQQLSKLIDRELKAPIKFELLMPIKNHKVASWCRFIHYLVEEFEHENSLMTMGPTVYNTVNTIITNLLYAQPNNYSDDLFSCSPSVVPACVKRAQNYMRENIASPITMNDLVNATDTNERSLFEHFKKFKKMTPMTYLRMLRLENVRNELITCQVKTSVTEVATKWGFSQLGRFSIMYKNIYGERPSETLRRRIDTI